MDHPNVVSITNMSPEEDRRMRFYVQLKQDGGDPSQLLDLLSTVVEREDWKQLTSHRGKQLTFLEYVTEPYPTGIGWSKEDVENMLKFHHKYERKPMNDPEVEARMKSMRAKVYGLIRTGLTDHGTNQRTLQCNVLSPKVRGNNEEYTVRRLRRDNSALADKVISGELSANAAAIQAGIRKRSISIALEPKAAACSIAKHFGRADRIELVRLLNEIEA